MNFQFHIPTQFIFGDNATKASQEKINVLGKKAAIITGQNSAKKCGALNDILEVLKNGGIDATLFDQVSPNPDIETVQDASSLIKKSKADIIIGIGGGSAIDTAKAAALLANNQSTSEDIFTANFKNPALPIIAIPTTAGTGTEATPYAIISDHTAENKRNLAGPSLFPRLALLDPRYTNTLPEQTTIATMIDTISHAAEGFLANRASPISDTIALESMRISGKCLTQLHQGATPDLAMRANLLYTSMLAGIVITHTGTTVLHAMGYPLTYFKKIAHGTANSFLMGEYFNFTATKKKEKINAVLKALQMNSIEDLKSKFNKLLPNNNNFTEAEIKKYASIAASAKNMNNTDPRPSITEIEEMLAKSLL